MVLCGLDMVELVLQIIELVDEIVVFKAQGIVILFQLLVELEYFRIACFSIQVFLFEMVVFS